MLSIRYNRRIESGRNKTIFQKSNRMKPFVNDYYWKGMNFLSNKDD